MVVPVQVRFPAPLAQNHYPASDCGFFFIHPYLCPHEYLHEPRSSKSPWFRSFCRSFLAAKRHGVGNDGDLGDLGRLVRIGRMLTPTRSRGEFREQIPLVGDTAMPTQSPPSLPSEPTRARKGNVHKLQLPTKRRVGFGSRCVIYAPLSSAKQSHDGAMDDSVPPRRNRVLRSPLQQTGDRWVRAG